jgi:hypothetical protein
MENFPAAARLPPLLGNQRMAIYYNLGIDCGSERADAERIAGSFADMTISVPNLEPVLVHVTMEDRRGLWFVGVWPKGMGHGTLPRNRPELLEAETHSKIEDALLDRLATTTGYRRAMFGAEAYDTLTFATPEEDNDIDYQGMIFSLRHFTPTSSLTTRAFCDEYLVVTDVER